MAGLNGGGSNTTKNEMIWTNAGRSTSMSDENTPSVEDIALTCAAVALGGVWMLGGEWWPLGMVLAVVGWCGAIAGLIVRRDR